MESFLSLGYPLLLNQNDLIYLNYNYQLREHIKKSKAWGKLLIDRKTDKEGNI